MSSIQNMHVFATELYDLVSEYLMGFYSDEEVIAITCRGGEYVIEAGHPSRLEVNCTTEIYHFKELIRIGDDGFCEPDNDKLNDIVSGWVFWNEKIYTCRFNEESLILRPKTGNDLLIH